MKRILLSILWLGVLASSPAFAAPFGTSFTYQGRLNDSGSPANGTYDFRFILYNADSGGSQVGPTLTNSTTSVADGLFTATLDFGSGLLDGTAYWLEISVRTNIVGAFVQLNPRQPLTPAPYAEFAPNAGTATTAVTATTASSVGPGAVPTSGLADGAVTSAKIADATITPGDLNLPAFADTFWAVQGNAGTTPGTDFLGTTDDQPLELRVNNRRAFQLMTTRSNDTVNVLGGSPLNYIDPNLISATIAGGGTPSFNGGPQTNSVGSDFATIGGGAGNRIGTNSNSGIIAGGFGHTILDNSFDGTIGGGSFHTIGTNAWYSTIGGGTGNWIQDNSSVATIGGGSQNRVWTNAWYATIGGGTGNWIQETAGGSTVAGGLQNRVGTNAPYATIAGGLNNTAASNFVATTISGGQANFAAANHATIGGGLFNTNSGPGATISGGNGNVTEANDTVIGGGIVNRIGPDSWRSVIGGGNLNVISSNSLSATIGGGQQNGVGVNSTASTIGGGFGNSITDNASFATVPGGLSNVAQGNYSFAAGRRAKADHFGAFVWADSTDADFHSALADEFAVRAAGGARFETSGAGLTVDGQPVSSATHNHYGQVWSGADDVGLSVATSSTTPNAVGLVGRLTVASAGASSAGVLGVNDGTGGGGAGVWGTHNGGGSGVRGESVNGYGVYAYSQNSEAIHAAGSVGADKLVYNTARTHYVAIPGDVFTPRTVNSTIGYASVLGDGGAFITAGTERRMRAPLNLPDGAVITSFKVYFSDNSTQDLTAEIVNYSPGGYGSIATVDSSGITGIGSKSVAVNNTIQNNGTFYLVWVTSNGTWSTEGSNLKIQGVTVGYTITEAE